MQSERELASGTHIIVRASRPLHLPAAGRSGAFYCAVPFDELLRVHHVKNMKIGVISDTHLRKPTPLLERVVDEYFHDSQIIIHAGDVVSPEVLEVFRDKDLYVVSGNRDNDLIQRKYPAKQTIELKGFRIGIVHGWGPAFGLPKRVLSSFENADCIVFGHSHIPVIRHHGSTLLFNPGAFCGGIFSLWRRTIGILTLDEEIKAEVIRIS